MSMRSLHPSGSMTSDYTPWRATKFYIPLVIQSVSQSLTYPLVAAIASHGVNGVLDLAAFSQGLSMMFVIAAFGGGLLTTGMVFGRDAEGFEIFKRLNLRMGIILVALQAIVCLPEFKDVVFQRVLGLPVPMDEIARQVLLNSVPLQFLFFLRNPPLVALYNARASASANWATLCRIVLTGLLAPLFIHYGWVGHQLAMVAMTVPVALETLLTRWIAKPYVRKLETCPETVPSERTQFMFTIPISFGGVLLAVSGFMIGAFIARAPEPARMLPIHYVAMGIINPVSYAALRMQSVVLAFPPQDRRACPIFSFALGAGLLMMAFPLMAQIPAISSWYFGTVQNLPTADIPLVTQAMMLITILPVLQAIRGHAEGLAAWLKRPNAILAGQAVYLASLMCTLFIGLSLGLLGYLMGIIAILVAVTLTLLTIRMGLAWAEMEDSFDPPSGNARDAEGQTV